jgi:hypothetical protein
MADKTKIIERIQKLLALATSSNVHEAAAAAARAQALMAQYDIEQAALEVESGDDDVVVSTEVLWELGARVDGWKGILASALGTANQAKVYTSRTWGSTGKLVNTFQIIGSKDQANTIRYMYAYLTNEVERLAKDAPGSGRSYLASFRLGAAAEIATRLRDAAIQARKEVKVEAAKESLQAGNGASLVRLQGALDRIDARSRAIAAHAGRLNLRKTSGRRASDADGYHAGKVAGSTVRLGGGPSLGKGSSGSIRG